MNGFLQPCSLWNELIDEHRNWLSVFDSRCLRNWEKLLKGDYEAGLAEAATRRFLQRHRIGVEPNEDLAGLEQRPDFRCAHAEGVFFVDAACISIKKATEESGLSHPWEPGPRNYRHLNDVVFNICKGKATQCSTVGEATLVAVGTFHEHASALCFQRRFADMLLTGEQGLSWLVDQRTGSGLDKPFQTTDLFSATFLAPRHPGEIGDARASISGILLCGFGWEPPKVLGVLHPGASRPFRRELLPDIAFGEVRVDHTEQRLYTEWSEANQR